VAVVAARAAKKILPEAQRGVEIFFKPLVIPLLLCFCGTNGAIDEYRFTCVKALCKFFLKIKE
jgi:hypothetical protein